MAWEIPRRPSDSTDLLVCIPHTGFTRMDWSLTMKHLDMPLPFMTFVNQGQPIDLGRNIFVSTALQKKAKYIAFIDSDVEIPSNGLTLLYEAKKPIVAGIYCGRAPPYALSANINRKPVPHDIVTKYPGLTVEVHEIGMGCALIDMRVIERIARDKKFTWRCIKSHAKELGAQLAPDETSPKEIAIFSNEEARQLGWKCGYCQSTIVADFFLYTMTSAELSQKYGLYSEDYFFCKLARDVGFPISIHTGIFCHHELLNMKLTKEGLYNPVQPAGEI